jgi:hypothetical protein
MSCRGTRRIYAAKHADHPCRPFDTEKDAEAALREDATREFAWFVGPKSHPRKLTRKMLEEASGANTSASGVSTPNISKNIPPLGMLDAIPDAALAPLLNMLSTDEQLALLATYKSMQKHPAWKAVREFHPTKPVSFRQLAWVVKHMPNLRSVQLPPFKVRGDFDDEWLKELAKLKRLESLLLAGMLDGVTEHGMKALADLKHLKALSLSSDDSRSTTTISKNCIWALAVNLTNLTSLKLHSVSEMGLYAITDHMGNLTSLSVAGCGSLNDRSAKSLSKLKNLESLSLQQFYALTDTGAKFLAELANLTSLRVTFSEKLGDEGVAHLSKLTNLESLDLEGSCQDLTDQGVKHLADNLANLTSLNLAYCGKVTNEGIKALATMRRLASLALGSGGAPIRWSVQELAGLKHLATLDLQSCRNCSAEDLNFLESAMTQTKVLHKLLLRNRW